MSSPRPRRGRAARLNARAATPSASLPALSEERLTEMGLEPPEKKTGRILLIACGALAREILDIKAANGLDHLDLTCLPAKLHLYPDQITEQVGKSLFNGTAPPTIRFTWSMPIAARAGFSRRNAAIWGSK